MANPELGGKQICPACTTKFYDLNRRPAVCPKCGAEFDPEEALRNRRVRGRGGEVEEEADRGVAPAAAETEDGFEPEGDEAPGLDAVVDEPPLITDDDADEPDAAAPVPAETLGVDFTADEDLADSEDDSVPFIEDEEDAFPEADIDTLTGERRSDNR